MFLSPVENVEDTCAVCREPVYRWRWCGRWIEQMFPPSPYSPYHPGCEHITHLICARQWLSSGSGASQQCMICRRPITNLVTLDQAYKTWSVSASNTVVKVMTAVLFFFGVMGGGMLAKLLFGGHPLAIVAGMVGGFALVMKSGVVPKIANSINSAIDTSYSWYYDLN